MKLTEEDYREAWALASYDWKYRWLTKSHQFNKPRVKYIWGDSSYRLVATFFEEMQERWGDEQDS